MAYNREYYQRNRESYKVASDKWKKQNKEKFMELLNRSRAKHPETRLYHNARTRAAKLDLMFAITKADIVVPDKCPYLGCVLTHTYGKGRVWSNASIDRIDANEGYVPGNIQVISDLANRMKQDATLEQLIAFAKGVLHLHADTRTGLYPDPVDEGELV